ncbi:ABC transporter substrate-binding protein [Cohnella lubricantis]|uniref:ABC transporter substrate-binding protein n=1 Tax=Cohnella lubricantis TaxID=2163172 RepID=A0A841TCV8_9BACL|nr:ABC transporter substrate-binding protein [Cohnella lubricantis]MBB6677188.1 ABC transporter substrate-binding protein [Cohnella lubricantis]MBP2117001.1 ABC-type nitrate/sulfonate/bicarbonate transport system substrate-binding protein [Cohnella lubricantis]
MGEIGSKRLGSLGNRLAWKGKGIAALAAVAILAGCGNNGSNDGGASSPASSPSPSGAASASASAPASLGEVKVVLDWTPNTNHTGLYVAAANGYWEKRGLTVDIVQPPESGADAMVASGAAEFGIGAQEGLTLAREQNVPLVSLAAIIQHNTSGFASPEEKNIKEPKDFEGHAYGGWGSPAEEAVIGSMMKQQGADVGQVKFVNAGTADFFTAVTKDIDFEWIFYAWTGIEAEQRGMKLNMVYLKDFDQRLDYYTPVLETSEKLIQNEPDVVRAFVEGAAEGYQYAIDHPDEAADILLKAVPDLNADLVKASQEWLSPRYQDDASQWGLQKEEVWSGYAEFLKEHGVLTQELDYDAMYTNDFLPQNS